MVSVADVAGSGWRSERIRRRAGRNPAVDVANPLISGATGSMPDRTFAHLERFSGLYLQRAVAANAAACSTALMQHADRSAA